MEKRAGKWLALPPFKPSIDPSSVWKAIMGQRSVSKTEPTTAPKWVRRCCPQLPVPLVHKLFRLRRELMVPKNTEVQAERQQLKRLSAKYAIRSGDVFLLPGSVQELTSEKYERVNTVDEINFIHSLELYKDLAIILANKLRGMPVQVHRLGRDSSGVLVLGRQEHSKASAKEVSGTCYWNPKTFKGIDVFSTWKSGGEMIVDVYEDYSTYSEPPSRFEAGTRAIGGAIGLGAAIDYPSSIGMQRIHDYEVTMLFLADYLYHSLSSLPNVRIYGPPGTTHPAALCSFNVENIHPTDIATILDEQHGVAILSGHHFAQLLHQSLGVDSSARGSLYFHNTK